MKKLLETGMLLFAVMGFWGMIYPDLCFVKDVCTVCAVQAEAESENAAGADSAEMKVQVKAAGGEYEKWEEMPADIFTRLCMAEPEQIRIKSKFAEVLTESKGNSDVISKR